jgi:hypothetical protein
MDRYRVVRRLFNADDFLVEAQGDADAAHLILKGFNELAIDELEQTWTPFDQDDGDAESSQNRGVLASDHSTAHLWSKTSAPFQ